MNRQRMRRLSRSLAAAASLLAATLGVITPASAQDTEDYIARANAMVAPVSGTIDALPVLFDAMIDMEYPSVVGNGFLEHSEMTRLLLVGADSPQWSKAAEWAAAESQQAVLEAVATITDPEEKYELGIPLGRNASEQKYIDAGLWIDIGEPELLADMEFIYGSRLETVFYLLSVEAERRALEDDSEGAAEVLADWIRLARMWTRRHFAAEKIRGIMQIIYALERTRDIVFTYPDLMSDEDLEDFIADELDERALEEQQIRIALGDVMALRQLIQQTFTFRGGPNEQFPLYMARVTTRDRPLRIFQEAARWRDLAAGHAGWYDVQDEVDKIEGDWVKRWTISLLRDPFHARITDYQRSDKAQYAMFEPVIDAVENLFWMRLLLYTEVGGTRTALGLAAFRYDNGSIPRTSKAIQPRYRRIVDGDPFDWDTRQKRDLPFGFFVPIRDVNWGPRDIPGPHNLIVHSYYLDPMILLENVRYTTFPVRLPNGPSGPGLEAMAGGSASGLLLAEMAAMGVTPQMVSDRFSALPEGAIDWQTLDVDFDVMLDLVNQQIDASDGDPRSFNAGINNIRPGGPSASPEDLTPEIRRQFITEGIWNRGARPMVLASGVLPSVGVTINAIDDLVEAFAAGFAEEPELAMMFEHINERSHFTPAEVKDIYRAGARVLFTEPVWAKVKEVYAQLKNGEPFVTEIISQLQSGGSLDLEVPTSFPFSIDDSEFILYSYGWDGEGERASVVHPLEGDILIWPPVLSLTRMHLNGINAIEDGEE